MALQLIASRLVGKPKIRKMDGRKYYVFKMRVMREGVVRPCNAPPTLFRGKDIDRYAPAWNLKPVVIHGHPQNKRGKYISAAKPSILRRSKVGFLLNSKFNGRFLEADAWIDILKVQKAEPRFGQYMERGWTMEVSGGVESDSIQRKGYFEGTRYKQIASRYRPDHVAILMDDIGACSVADGCGLLVARKGISPKKMKRVQEAVTNAWKGINSSCSCHKRKETSMKTKEKGKKVSRKKLVNRLISMKVGWKKKNREWLSRLDGEDLRQLLVHAKQLKPVDTKIKSPSKPDRRRATDDTEIEEETGIRRRRRKKTEGKKKTVKKAKHSRKERLANAGGKTSKKRKKLTLKSILSSMTPQQVVKAMPGRLGEVFANGLKAHGHDRKRLIDIIVSSDNSEFEKEELRDETRFPLSTLRKMAKLAIREEEENEDEYAPFMAGTPGAPIVSSGRHAKFDQHLVMPSMPIPEVDEKE